MKNLTDDPRVQSGFLANLAPDRRGAALTRLDTATRDHVILSKAFTPAFHQQQVTVRDDDGR